MMTHMEAGTDRPEILDLTRVLDRDLPIYADDAYADPPFEMEDWCTIEGQGYKVARLSMGTQTGTHIDAPAHFAVGGAALEALPLGALIGPYLWLDLHEVMQGPERGSRPACQGETILFLTSSARTETGISEEVFDALLDLPCTVWLSVYGVRVAGRGPLYFHQALADAGKYLIEDVDEGLAMRVRPGGELIALPLRLKGASGAPCRVVVRQPLTAPMAHAPDIQKGTDSRQARLVK
jgi:kynurenine formamidase